MLRAPQKPFESTFPIAHAETLPVIAVLFCRNRGPLCLDHDMNTNTTPFDAMHMVANLSADRAASKSESISKKVAYLEEKLNS